MQETKTGRPQAGGRVLILKKVRENTLLLYYRLVLARSKECVEYVVWAV